MNPIKILDYNRKKINFFEAPRVCPLCRKNISPVLLNQKLGVKDVWYCFFQCPAPDCKTCFSALYTPSPDETVKGYFFKKVVKPISQIKAFPDEIELTSPSFVKIYNEAYAAEQTELNEISGMAYRKALEFLIKDFLIKICMEDEEKIKKMQLGKCINDCVDNQKIKETAKRAAWLGNDHTHYYKKWVDHDINKLKTLVDLTVNWVHSEILYRNLTEEMPE